MVWLSSGFKAGFVSTGWGFAPAAGLNPMIPYGNGRLTGVGDGFGLYS